MDVNKNILNRTVKSVSVGTPIGTQGKNQHNGKKNNTYWSHTHFEVNSYLPNYSGALSMAWDRINYDTTPFNSDTVWFKLEVEGNKGFNRNYNPASIGTSFKDRFYEKSATSNVYKAPKRIYFSQNPYYALQSTNKSIFG